MPVAALRTATDGETIVETSSGETKPVRLLSAQSGWALVDGVEVGEVVVLPEAADA